MGDLWIEEGTPLDPTLGGLINSKTIRWIFVGGKGGVGKTTTSCSIAVQLSKLRENVLILSTDPAHNLSDAFTQKFTSEPTLVQGFPNLYAMEIDSNMSQRGGLQMPDADDFGLSKLLPDLVSAFPGIDEAMSFAELMQAVQTMQYSVIVFDTAPTGHTLRLLSFPDLLEKAFEKLQTVKEKFGGAFGMLGAMGDEGIGKKFEHIRAVTTSVREMFQDPTRTTFVCVCIAEFLSVYETERLVQELAKQEIDSSYIVINQILFPIEACEKYRKMKMLAPEEVEKKLGAGHEVCKDYRVVFEKAKALEDSHLARRKMQSKYLAQIRDLYSLDFHVVPMPLRSEEVRGIESLTQFGQLLLQKRDLPIVSDD